MTTADNTLRDANPLGTLSGNRDLTGTFDRTDELAYYKFTLDQNTNLTVARTGGIRLRIIADLNGNNFVDDGEVVYREGGSSNANFIAPLPAGTYFLEAEDFLSGTTSYTINLVPQARPGNVSPDPGEILAEALDLGVLSGQRILRDYVGEVLDSEDYYKFTLAQKSNLGILKSGTTGNIRFSVIQDTNNNGVVDSGERLSQSSDNDAWSVNLAAGTYFLGVLAPGVFTTTGSQYELTINTVSRATVINGTVGNDLLTGTNDDDTMSGLEGNDTINAFGGNDVLFGGLGRDTLSGGLGRDTLNGGQGQDFLSGGQGADVLNGGLGGDFLAAGLGMDLLNGGVGPDTLQGGGGTDTFLFSVLDPISDDIVDYNPLEDEIHISTVFGGGLTAGGLPAAAFALGSAAADASDRFIYNQSTGALLFDVDGTGATAAVQIARFVNLPTLSADDIVIV